MFHKRLVGAFDLIILSGCCSATLQAWFIGIDWIWSLSVLNCIALVALRQWLMNSLQIHWKASPLNIGLKQATDIAISIALLLTLFPIIIVVMAILIKNSKQYGGSIFAIAKISVGDKKNFNALVFSNCPENCKIHIGMTPLILRILTGTISLCDITSLSVEHVSHMNHTLSTEHTSPDDARPMVPIAPSESKLENITDDIVRNNTDECLTVPKEQNK